MALIAASLALPQQDTWQEEQLHQDKQRSPSVESSTSQKLLGGEKKLLEHKRGERSSLSQRISIPCLVKQPKQPEIKGVIQKDLGDRFTVYIPDSDSTITVPKLFVYPDLKQLDKCSRKNLPSSKNCSSKTVVPTKQWRSRIHELFQGWVQESNLAILTELK